MADYEMAAAASVQRLRERHVGEAEQRREALAGRHKVKYTMSRELLAIRREEKLMSSVKELDRAEELRVLGDIREREERARIEDSDLNSKLGKEEVKILQHQ
jgi:hypothetical protein